MNDDTYDPPVEEPYEPPEPDEPYDPGDTDPAEASASAGAESGEPPTVWSVDDLASTVMDLAEQVTQLNALLGASAAGWEVQAGLLRAGLDALIARVDELEPAPEEEPEEPEPKAWVDTATGQDWQELAEWTDWLIRTYDVQRSHMVLGCWPAHRGVAEELAALRTAWRAAAIKGAKPTPNDALIYWHDRWLHPTLIRIRGEFQQRNCPDGHRPTSTGRPTDPDLLTAAKTEAASVKESTAITPTAGKDTET